MLIDINNLWQYPFGVQVFYNDKFWTYTDRVEGLGILLVDSLGLHLYEDELPEELTVSVSSIDLQKLKKALQAQVLLLLDEPEMHKDALAYALTKLQYVNAIS